MFQPAGRPLALTPILLAISLTVQPMWKLARVLAAQLLCSPARFTARKFTLASMARLRMTLTRPRLPVLQPLLLPPALARPGPETAQLHSWLTLRQHSARRKSV